MSCKLEGRSVEEKGTVIGLFVPAKSVAKAGARAQQQAKKICKFTQLLRRLAIRMLCKQTY